MTPPFDRKAARARCEKATAERKRGWPERSLYFEARGELLKHAEHDLVAALDELDEIANTLQRAPEAIALFAQDGQLNLAVGGLVEGYYRLREEKDRRIAELEDQLSELEGILKQEGEYSE